VVYFVIVSPNILFQLSISDSSFPAIWRYLITMLKRKNCSFYCRLQQMSKCLCIQKCHKHAVCFQISYWLTFKSRLYRSQSITFMPVMSFGKCTCDESKIDVTIHVQSRVLSVKTITLKLNSSIAIYFWVSRLNEQTPSFVLITWKASG